MTFYQKLEMLCKSRGTTVTALATELGFSSSAGTTWKKSKGLPRNSTLKKIADYFEIGIEELEDGVSVPIDYASVDTSAFNQEVWQHLLEKNEYNEQYKYFFPRSGDKVERFRFQERAATLVSRLWRSLLPRLST